MKVTITYRDERALSWFTYQGDAPDEILSQLLADRPNATQHNIAKLSNDALDTDPLGSTFNFSVIQLIPVAKQT